MKENVIDFLKKNNFFLTISLDGPNHVNDAYRMFPNGKGTFDKIIKNISIIENKKYPFQLIKFNTTIVQDSYLSDQANFFDNLSKEKGYSPNPFFVNKRESNLNELIKKNPGSLDSSYIKELRSQFKHNLIKKM